MVIRVVLVVVAHQTTANHHHPRFRFLALRYCEKQCTKFDTLTLTLSLLYRRRFKADADEDNRPHEAWLGAGEG
jgi:hypothetical protein